MSLALHIQVRFFSSTFQLQIELQISITAPYLTPICLTFIVSFNFTYTKKQKMKIQMIVYSLPQSKALNLKPLLKSYQIFYFTEDRFFPVPDFSDGPFRIPIPSPVVSTGLSNMVPHLHVVCDLEQAYGQEK